MKPVHSIFAGKIGPDWLTLIENAHFNHDISMKPHQLAEGGTFYVKRLNISRRIYENPTSHLHGGWGSEPPDRISLASYASVSKQWRFLT